MNTREQLEQGLKESLSSADLAEVDQLLASVFEGHRYAERNRHLVNHPMIDRLIRARANGAMACDEEIQAEFDGVRPTPSAVQVLGGGWCGGVVRELSDAEPSRQPVDYCDFCKTGATFDSIDVPAGRTVVEIRLCHSCADYLEQQWGPLVWSRGHGTMQR